jgi:Ca2+-binding EF-hand superfamily protein
MTTRYPLAVAACCLTAALALAQGDPPARPAADKPAEEKKAADKRDADSKDPAPTPEMVALAKEKIAALLKEFDTDRDGKLSRDEAKALFDRIDANKDDALDRNELLKVIDQFSPPEKAPAENAKDAKDAAPPSEVVPRGAQLVIALLREYDPNKDGKIDRDEFKVMFDRIDANKDGFLDRDELLKAAEPLLPTPDKAGSDKTPPQPEKTPARAPRERPATAPAEKSVRVCLVAVDVTKETKLSKEDVRAKALAQFDSLDLNKDGYLDSEELLKAADKAPGDRPKPPAKPPG